jgi:SAM-dependent methyltransferase
LPKDAEADLARYYDQEAAARADRPIDPRRVARRDAFIAQIRAVGVSTVLEVGIGPGRDATAFVAAGNHVVGVDLSAAHVRMAHEIGAHTARASVHALPLADAVCDAGWTMSTFVHVPNASFDAAMTELCRVVRPGAPLAIGLWGAPVDTEGVIERDTIMPKRFFSRRTDDHVRAMLEPYGAIERFETWRPENASTWWYQYVVVRTNS